MFFAHSTERQDRSDWHSLKEHLEKVAAYTSGYAEKFGAGDWGRIAGLLHDIGKYSHDFQRERLQGGGKHVDHSTVGAKIAEKRYGPAGRLIAFCLAGHHAGLANGAGDGVRSTLKQRLGREVPALDPHWRDEIQLPASLTLPPLRMTQEEAAFSAVCLARMLFSCLIDADRLDTASFYARLEGKDVPRFGYVEVSQHRELLARLRGSLDADLAEKKTEAQARPDPRAVNRLRADILTHARAKASERPGLFSLTVPTGGGKTLTSLAFALDHALHHGLDRVIYVIPFTSIVEQTAAAFRKALGDDVVLEHHSAFDEEKLLAGYRRQGGEEGPEGREKLRLAAENWGAPVVVTTAVQFFESLFSDRPSRCRKLHNIARSVVVLDEAQTLPLRLLRPCVAALKELARNYGTSVVLCTATQPALIERPNEPERSFKGGFRDVCELAPDPPGLYRALRRVTVTHAGLLDDDALAERLRRHDQLLCIVNNRRHARELYRTIADAPGSRHLTTLMCAAHRSEVLASIRQEMNEARPCRLVATSLIEAGVDVDFPIVFRAEAGIDSIAQAAGRCNREGRNDPRDSVVTVFEAPAWRAPTELKQFAAVGRAVLRRHREDPLSLDAVQVYFEQLYWQRGEEELDKCNILGQIQERRSTLDFPFETVASLFRMIESGMRPIIIPLRVIDGRTERDAKVEGLIRHLRHAERVGRIARELQRHLVQVPPNVLHKLVAAGAVEAIEPKRFGDQFMLLRNRDLYRPDTGLDWDDPTFREAERDIW